MSEPRQKPEFLIVDDKPRNLSVLEKLLRKLDVEVIPAASGVEALGLTLEHDFCLAIVDVQMPEMDGYEFVELLRGNPSTANLPVIFISAVYSDEYYHRKGYDAGAVDFLSKPFVPEILLSKAQVFLDLYHQRVKLQELVNEQAAIAIENARLYEQAQREITKRKRAEEALREYSERLEEMVEERTKELQDAQEQLVRQEKLAVLGQLAGGVGHELRNPLGAIKNAAYFLNMALEEPDPEVKETLEILEKEVATSERTISSLLDFARTKPPTWRKVDINEVVQEVLSQIAVPENVEVVSQLDGTLPAIRADPDQLGQVFGNIILNAVQAMPEGGRLVVRSEVPSPDWVAVSFADTGVGISKENLGKLFEPLFTTKAKGIGLGLAVTKTLLEGHGGSIEVESEVGVGTTFTVRLPMSGS